MKKIISLLACLLPVALQAQTISTPSDTIDCGQVVFKHPVNAEFKMRNAGKLPLIIKDVRTSCGCTTVNYPQQAIAAGDNFTISTTYDAKQMGHFIKQIGIWSNASVQPRILTIKGVVVGKIKSFEGDYPYSIGDVTADKAELEFDNVNKGEMPIQTIHIYNSSSENLEPQLMHLPPYIKGVVKPARIAPNHSGTVTLQVDSKKLHDLGLTQTSIFLGMFPGDKIAPEKEIPVNIILMPDFEKLTDSQMANAPRLQLSKGRINLGSFGSREKKKDDIEINNIGKSTLTIRSLQIMGMGLEVSLNEQNIEPGESAKLKVKGVKNLLQTSRTRPRILMITNDPTQPKIIINVDYERQDRDR